ncbi:hypothetical protein LshimejAT787_5200010 [Lyophyllum shimeji]|uniref:Reverse transcriptase domain-containing protein n=1 Tax=Lyophyllum shimeji TaxID=47721 RepID=A0A9P3UVK2_LYOSH|nr:hypothetical protein LshimejAT787_5200010 [Lyophyllum shimeji]
MEHIAKIGDIVDPNGQLGKFFRHLIPKSDKGVIPKESFKIPQFYGIPKIHKTPVKFRPILPCFNAIQNPAAKYVSKKLKPIIKSAPSVIHGTKDLAIKLSKLSIAPNRQWFIATGDVVAYYPTIDLVNAKAIALDKYTEFRLGRKVVAGETLADSFDDDLLNELRLFAKCLDVGNDNLIVQFEDKFFHQHRGLAMGVADSPDLANLYGLAFEEECGILDDVRVPFYGRYIDDCLAIVYARSEAEVKAILSVVKIDQCTIEWNVSATSQPFLDMLIYRDSDGSLQHAPYGKARNHHKRIPFHSAHPIDVKKGTFSGEMSRMATLSSTLPVYKEAVKDLIGLYCNRGYPERLLKSWAKSQIDERWSNRLRVKEDKLEGVLVLKTEFNQVWEYFNVKELGMTITSVWRKWLTKAEYASRARAWHEAKHSTSLDPLSLAGIPAAATMPIVVKRGDGSEFVQAIPDVRKLDILERRWITSRKRTLNLHDLTNSWKKIVMEHVAEAKSSKPITEKETDAPVADAPPESDDNSDGRRSPDVGDPWRSAHMGNFGRF